MHPGEPGHVSGVAGPLLPVHSRPVGRSRVHRSAWCRCGRLVVSVPLADLLRRIGVRAVRVAHPEAVRQPAGPRSRPTVHCGARLTLTSTGSVGVDGPDGPWPSALSTSGLSADRFADDTTRHHSQSRCRTPALERCQRFEPCPHRRCRTGSNPVDRTWHYPNPVCGAQGPIIMIKSVRARRPFLDLARFASLAACWAQGPGQARVTSRSPVFWWEPRSGREGVRLIRRGVARVPAGEVGGEVSVEDAGAKLEEQVTAAPRRSHLLLLHYALADHLGDRAFLIGRISHVMDRRLRWPRRWPR
jgi:hypothetical protein